MLFVSGERPERFPKALAAGADLACIDLEDAVHPDRKAEARQAACRFLADRVSSEAKVALRINALSSQEGLKDVLAVAESGVSVDYLILPKVQDAADLRYIHQWIGDGFKHLVALIETPLGIEQVNGIAAAVKDGAPKLTALMLGGADLTVELGARFNWAGLLGARHRIVNASKAHGLQAWDVPFIDVSDAQGLLDETRAVIGLGFDCKSAIHPSQVGVIHSAFAPSEDDLKWAQGLAQAIESQGGMAHIKGAFLYNGKLVDAPILKRAERILTASALTETTIH